MTDQLPPAHRGRVPGSSRRALLGLGLAAGLPRPALTQAAGQRLAVAASARPSDVPFRSDDFDMVGVFDADWLAEARYGRLLDAMAASPGGFGAVRFFGALNAGSLEQDFPTASGGTWRDPAQPPDFSAALGILQNLVGRGLVPFVNLTFFPPAVSPSPIEPPADFSRWQRLVREFLDAAVARFGAPEVARWWLEVWNEPNMPPFWRGSFDRYLDLYRATVEAVRASGHRVRLGGPAIAWMPPDEGPSLMERFLRFLHDEPGMPCDFLSFHRKGIWVTEEAEPLVSRPLEAAETTAELALRLVPERCARGLALVNNEADMRVGFQQPYAPRMSERFPAWLAALAAGHAGLTARYAARGLRFLAAADNANQHLVREPFDGRRALMTPTASERPGDLIKLPVFGFYELLRLLGGNLCAADALRDGLHQLATADDQRIGVLLTHYPEDPAAPGGVVQLDWTLAEIPWRRVNLALFRIDGALSNAFAANGRRMPSPPIGPAEARRLRMAAELAQAAPIRRGLVVEGGRLGLSLQLEPFATVLVSITPFDPAPPAAPRWIEASIEHGDAVLRWTPSREPGLLGYELLRLDPTRRVAPMPLRAAMWVDTAPPRGTALRYAVRAVSTSGQRSPLVVAPSLRH
jgi:xylan 1,4-beta-xylosidase